VDNEQILKSVQDAASESKKAFADKATEINNSFEAKAKEIETAIKDRASAEDVETLKGQLNEIGVQLDAIQLKQKGGQGNQKSFAEQISESLEAN
jgi:hypothetical protein